MNRVPNIPAGKSLIAAVRQYQFPSVCRRWPACKLVREVLNLSLPFASWLYRSRSAKARSVFRWKLDLLKPTPILTFVPICSWKYDLRRPRMQIPSSYRTHSYRHISVSHTLRTLPRSSQTSMLPPNLLGQSIMLVPCRLRTSNLY